MCIETYGSGERIKVAARNASQLGISHLVLLPVPSTKDKKHVSDTEISLSDTLCNIKRGSVIAGYGLPEWYKTKAEKLGAETLDLSLNEDFLVENAYITAIGTIGYILTTEKRTPSLIRFGVMGYGRIGSQLVRMLLFLGAKVRVYTSKSLTRLDLGECGIDSVAVSDISGGVYDFSELDILINTAPADVSKSFPDKTVPPGLRVLELASGENFRGVSGVERLPSLPEKMYPESAGLAYTAAIKKFVFEK